MKKTDVDLLRRYRRYSRKRPRRDPLRGGWTAVILAALLCVGIWRFLEFQDRRLEEELTGIQSWLDDPANVAAYEEMLAKKAVLRQLQYDTNTLTTLTARLSGYPSVESRLLARIVETGGERVSVQITGYDAESGQLNLDAASVAVIDAPVYVRGLEETGLFQTVSYTGYTYEEGVYELHLACTLRARAGKEES